MISRFEIECYWTTKPIFGHGSEAVNIKAGEHEFSKTVVRARSTDRIKKLKPGFRKGAKEKNGD